MPVTRLDRKADDSMSADVKVALAADHGGFELKEAVKKFFDSNGISYTDFGIYAPERCDYPVLAEPACLSVRSGECTAAVLICGTGIGMSIAANKFRGIRAACCTDTYSARMTRQHNDANVLCLGERVIGEGLALDIVKVFLETGFDGGRHAQRVGLIAEIESRNFR